jgi:predicted PurR-regulated permease PerM
VGFIIAVPVAATVIEVLKYFRLRAQGKEYESPSAKDHATKVLAVRKDFKVG